MSSWFLSQVSTTTLIHSELQRVGKTRLYLDFWLQMTTEAAQFWSALRCFALESFVAQPRCHALLPALFEFFP